MKKDFNENMKQKIIVFSAFTGQAGVSLNHFQPFFFQVYLV
jgi:hypothetical protein